MKKTIISSIIFAFLFIGLAHQHIFAAKGKGYRAPIVRVAVVKDVPQLEISIKSGFRIMPLETDEVLYAQESLKGSSITPTPWGLKIGDMEFKIYGIRIVPSADSAIFVNNRSFRGEVDIIRQRDQTLLVVNHINVEDYLRGVLYHEVSHWWPKAALEAQAIASRTFALYQADVNRNKDYDLESTVFSQVYGGSTSEKFRTNQAIYSTTGKVLVYRGRIFPAYFHATCAGHTEDASVLWGTDIPPLKGVVCNFCRQSPHFYWKRKIPVSDIEKALAIDDILDIVPEKWDNSGRVISLKIKTPYNATDVTGKDFRLKVGSNVIKSTIFKIQVKPDAKGILFVYIDGAGWGHGVGMCQWGAFGMALREYSTEKILKHYYPGANIEIYSE